MIALNQFDNANFLNDPKIKKVNQELLLFIDYVYDEIIIDYPELNVKDEQWFEILKTPIKLKYFKESDYCNDFILFTLIKYDVNRFLNIVSQVKDEDFLSLYFNLKTQSCIGDVDINYNAFISLFTRFLFSEQFPILARAYCDHTYFHSFINLRLLLPVYSVLIPKFLQLNKKYPFIERFVDYILLAFINRYQFIDIPDWKKEFIEKMYSLLLLIQNYFLTKFINESNISNLEDLSHSIIEPIKEEQSTIVFNFIHENINSISNLQQIKKCCKFTTQQLEFINSFLFLKKI